MKNEIRYGFRIFCGNSFIDGVYMMPEWTMSEVIRKAENHEGIVTYLEIENDDLVYETTIYHPTLQNEVDPDTVKAVMNTIKKRFGKEYL